MDFPSIIFPSLIFIFSPIYFLYSPHNGEIGEGGERARVGHKDKLMGGEGQALTELQSIEAKRKELHDSRGRDEREGGRQTSERNQRRETERKKRREEN